MWGLPKISIGKVTATSIEVSWITEIQITPTSEFRLILTNETDRTAFVKVQNLPGNVFSFEFRSLNPETMYSIKVR